MIAERSGLEKKEKSELQTIVSALGGKPASRARKVDLIDQIIELSGAEPSSTDRQQEDSANSEESSSDESRSEEPSSEETDNTVSTEEIDPANAVPPESDTEPNKRKKRSRGRGKNRENVGNDPIVSEPLAVEGYLELRDEGYGFLRVNSFLPSRDDIYVSVKQARQYNLRKGDHITGLSRPASRNEKNAGFHQINTVNGHAPHERVERPTFENLTPVFPDLEIQLQSDEGGELGPRLVDLFAPIGRGQRVLVSAPAQSGITTFLHGLGAAIEKNNPNIELFMLLIAQRPEEATWLRSALPDAEVITSGYDRPPEEHTAIAELTLERTKRLVEFGRDVCLIVDSMTKLGESYQALTPNGRNGIGFDAMALHQTARIFGAARNISEGGSLTIIGTATSNSLSPDADRLHQELARGASSQLVFREDLAAANVHPALDLAASSTRYEESILGVEQAAEFGRLRSEILRELATSDSAVDGTRRLHERLAATTTNDDFLADSMKTD